MYIANKVFSSVSFLFGYNGKNKILKILTSAKI